MGIHDTISSLPDIFSRRERLARGEMPDVYQYENIPGHLRVQIIHIFTNAINNWDEHGAISTFWEPACALLRKERGVFQLTTTRCLAEDEVRNYFLNETKASLCLDVIEMICRCLCWINTPMAAQGVQELNARFRESGVGFQFEGEMMVRVDSDFAHAEIVRPALALLRDPMYKGPNEEFHKSHEHYRNGLYGECLNECLKAFESTMKVICDKQGWPYDPKRATAKYLIEKCLNNGLVPNFATEQLTGLRVLLESGTPTTRNKTSSHGQGAVSTPVPASLAAFGLHTAAANILLLVQAEKALP